MNVRFALLLSLASVAASATLGCGPAEEPYKAKPAVSGKKASMPAVPTLPQKPKKTADGAYTVYGVTHDLRSRVHFDDVNGKPLSIVRASTPDASARSTDELWKRCMDAIGTARERIDANVKYFQTNAPRILKIKILLLLL